MTMYRGVDAASIQTWRGTHRGVRASTPPDQKVTALLAGVPGGHEMNVTTRCVSRRWMSPCGSGPYARPAAFRVAVDNSMVTRWPALTRSGNLFPPTPELNGVNAGVPPAPTSARGPTTKFRGLVNASRKRANDRVEQFATTPVGAA